MNFLWSNHRIDLGPFESFCQTVNGTAKYCSAFPYSWYQNFKSQNILCQSKNKSPVWTFFRQITASIRVPSKAFVKRQMAPQRTVRLLHSSKLESISLVRSAFEVSESCALKNCLPLRHMLILCRAASEGRPITKFLWEKHCEKPSWYLIVRLEKY